MAMMIRSLVLLSMTMRKEPKSWYFLGGPRPGEADRGSSVGLIDIFTPNLPLFKLRLNVLKVSFLSDGISSFRRPVHGG